MLRLPRNLALKASGTSRWTTWTTWTTWMTVRRITIRQKFLSIFAGTAGTKTTWTSTVDFAKLLLQAVTRRQGTSAAAHIQIHPAKMAQLGLFTFVYVVTSSAYEKLILKGKGRKGSKALKAVLNTFMSRGPTVWSNTRKDANSKTSGKFCSQDHKYVLTKLWKFFAHARC